MSAPNIIILRFTTNYHTPDGVPQNCIAIEGSSSPTIIRIVDHIKAITHHDLIKVCSSCFVVNFFAKHWTRELACLGDTLRMVVDTMSIWLCLSASLLERSDTRSAARVTMVMFFVSMSSDCSVVTSVDEALWYDSALAESIRITNAGHSEEILDGSRVCIQMNA